MGGSAFLDDWSGLGDWPIARQLANSDPGNFIRQLTDFAEELRELRRRGRIPRGQLEEANRLLAEIDQQINSLSRNRATLASDVPDTDLIPQLVESGAPARVIGILSPRRASASLAGEAMPSPGTVLEVNQMINDLSNTPMGESLGIRQLGSEGEAEFRRTLGLLVERTGTAGAREVVQEAARRVGGPRSGPTDLIRVLRGHVASLPDELSMAQRVQLSMIESLAQRLKIGRERLRRIFRRKSRNACRVR